MQKVAFLDRDGLINNDTGHYYIYKEEDFKLNDGIAESMKIIADSGFLIIIITNQGGISKGIYSRQDVEKIHNSFTDYMSVMGVHIAEIYCCPHHTDNERCLCRNPLPLLFEKAIARFNVDINTSFMIGDSQRDVDAAVAAGISGYKVDKNSSILELVKGLIDDKNI